MVKNVANSGIDPAPLYIVRRQRSGGTDLGRRPARYTYWRVGYGEAVEPAVPFVVERAGEYHTRTHYLTGSIDHPDANQLYYHLSGEAVFEQPNESTPVAAGNLLVIPRGHVGYYRSDQGMKYLWLSLGAYWPPELGALPSAQLLALRHDAELAGRFAEIRELLILQKPGYPLRVVSAFYGLLARITELRLTATTSVARSPYPDAVRNAIFHLREHIDVPYDGETTAAAANLSQSHLRALFERWVGESPRRFHTRSRIEHAARLLRDQELSVTAAALQIGFTDVRHFSRVFKSVTGLSPREYVQQQG